MSDHPLGMDQFGLGVAPEGLTARAGAPLQPGVPAADRLAVENAIRQVYDPEIPVNIYDLGLIYALDIHPDGSVAVEMTLTAPACPVAGEMPQQVAEAVAEAEGVGEVQVTLTWDPPWTPERMSEDAKLALGMF
ncbi:MAG: SUF system Fe-S cluster assembly protein [Kiloniellaceae bacterium]